jgi:hypothetical protein
MTGFEPATLTLAMSFGATFSPGTTRIVAAGLPFLMVHDSASDQDCQRRVVFRWCANLRILHHVHHIDGDISEQFGRRRFASARRGTSPSVAQRLSNSLTPRAPCSWRAVVGRVNQRSAAAASPNHRRLPLGFGHLPSLSSVVRTYPLMRPVGGMRRAFYPDSDLLWVRQDEND